MRIPHAWKTGILITALCLYASGQSPQSPPSPQSKEAQLNETKGMPPRATPADYQAHASAGTFTVAAEFLGHSFPTPQGTLTTDDYVVVEAALFGPADARLKIAVEEFSLRINEKKSPSPSQPFGMIFRSLKDPEWVPPDAPETKSKSSISTGGQGGQNDPPAPVHMPLELVRAMQQRVQKASLPAGDRALPQAGLIFFPYRGKGSGIYSLELTYAGPAGKATLMLQP